MKATQRRFGKETSKLLSEKCSRCAALGGSGSDKNHSRFYQLPMSPTSLDRNHWSVRDHPGKRFMGQWCICCLTILVGHLEVREREFLEELARNAGNWVHQGTYGPGIPFSRAVKDSNLGVYYNDLNSPAGFPHGRKQTGGWYGWPFSYDEYVNNGGRGRPCMVPLTAQQIVLDALKYAS